MGKTISLEIIKNILSHEEIICQTVLYGRQMGM